MRRTEIMRLNRIPKWTRIRWSTFCASSTCKTEEAFGEFHCDPSVKDTIRESTPLDGMLRNRWCWWVANVVAAQVCYEVELCSSEDQNSILRSLLNPTQSRSLKRYLANLRSYGSYIIFANIEGYHYGCCFYICLQSRVPSNI